MKRVLTIVGARPQFIKAAPVSRALKAAGLEEYSLHTGQHYDDEMSRIFFDQLLLKEPDINLAVGSGSHAEQTAKMLLGIEATIIRVKPACVLIFGDTNSTLAGALAASKLGVPVAHVEAGLRSFNKSMPEEQNRIVADHLSTWLFAPTPVALRNLAAEGIPESLMHLTGDVMYDAALIFGQEARRSSGVLDRLSVRHGEYILATLHRAANTNDVVALAACLQGLGLASATLPVILPLHPRTRNIATQNGLLNHLPERLRIIEPQGYLDMLKLVQSAATVATDSGGLQKEAFFFEVPCVTLRKETEWTELVDAGWNHLCPPESGEHICRAICASLGRRGVAISPYGTGDAAFRIASILAGAA